LDREAEALKRMSRFNRHFLSSHGQAGFRREMTQGIHMEFSPA